MTPLDVRAVVEAQTVAATLHGLAAREAVPHVEPRHLADLTAANGEFADALDRRDADAAVRADDAFHRVLVDLCANRVLAGVLDDVTPLLRRMEPGPVRLARRSRVRHAAPAHRAAGPGRRRRGRGRRGAGQLADAAAGARLTRSTRSAPPTHTGSHP
ncbi:hypothetical protein GCM10025868_11500 [Angustibacter aerolatus]|uniref:GntR C-terminal domain-containing protein n=1 Tax=Angustibacter aerolatus TaxID=1162965 RepID=A0ABQ6JGD7_9ACTN|nr:FCD domain-containing protein [Angustibacter aerolatus]GMA85900.1 hypothetical protein GCM10025868_11500 [Angustibacter aerolatus]